MTTVFISGATRGIGWELSTQYLRSGHTVFATFRDQTGLDSLNTLVNSTTNGSLTTLQLDVTSDSEVKAARTKLEGVTIDVLINNAGIMGGNAQSVDNMDYEDWLEVLQVNVIGPFRLAKAFKENLRLSNSPRIVTLSSIMGSLNRDSSGHYAYRSSKAAVNKVMKLLSEDLRDDGIVVCPIHPGWVQTDMGGAGAPIPVDKSAKGIISLIESLTPEHSGRFWEWDGTELPW